MSRDVFLQLRGCDKKWYIQRNPHSVSVPVYFYIVARRPQTIHTKLRVHISDLNQDLVIRHVSNDASCKCGSASEAVEHYLLHCPPYTQARGYTIQTLPRITLPHLCYWAVTHSPFSNKFCNILNSSRIRRSHKPLWCCKPSRERTVTKTLCLFSVWVHTPSLSHLPFPSPSHPLSLSVCLCLCLSL